jgi:hypothetical protein
MSSSYPRANYVKPRKALSIHHGNPQDTTNADAFRLNFVAGLPFYEIGLHNSQPMPLQKFPVQMMQVLLNTS